MTKVDIEVGVGSTPRRQQRQALLIEDVARPVVKWPGGKARLLDRLVKLAPDDLSSATGARYFEPFAGGAALFFALRPARASLADANADLVELYAEIALDPAGVHHAASEIFDHHDRNPKDVYYGVRSAWNGLRDTWTSQRRAATLLYLNRACFNGLFRLNKSGKNNTPIGKPSSLGAVWPSLPSLSRLIAAGVALRGADLSSGDFASCSGRAQRGDFAYFDPPYLPATSREAFSAYTGAGFSPADHERLAAHAHDLVGRGVRVMLSSVDSPLAREILTGFRLTTVTAPRSINCAATGRGKISELIATGGYDPVDADAAAS